MTSGSQAFKIKLPGVKCKEWTFLWITLVASARLCCGRSSRVDASHPNILIFLADDLGIGDIGCFGNTTLSTPNIDSLANDGVRLSHFLSAASVCTPSRAAFLTGRYPIRSGMGGVGGRVILPQTASVAALPPDELTFAEIAKQANYKTAMVGKWHLGFHQNWVGDHLAGPLNQGFDQWFGVPLGLLRDFDDKEDPALIKQFPRLKLYCTTVTIGGILLSFFLWKKQFIGIPLLIGLCLLIITPTYFLLAATHRKFLNSMLYRDLQLVEQPLRFENLSARLVQEGVKFLKKRHEDQEPFLLFMSWLQTHTPLHASESWRAKSRHGRYGAEVMELDWCIGEILKTLDKLNMHDNTLVMFTSDHGGHTSECNKDGEVYGGFNGIYKGEKGQGGMEGGIRTPTIIRWPGKVNASTEITVPLSNMDLLPTVADLVGVDIPKDRIIDGRSLVPLLTGETNESSHQVLIHYCSNYIHAVRFAPDKDDAVWKVRYATPRHLYVNGTAACKFICACDSKRDYVFHDTPLVFDVTGDPSENSPLDVQDPQHSQIIAAASKAVDLHKESIGQVDPQLTFWKTMFRPYLMPCCNFPYCQCNESQPILQ